MGGSNASAVAILYAMLVWLIQQNHYSHHH